MVTALPYLYNVFDNLRFNANGTEQQYKETTSIRILTQRQTHGGACFPD